MTFKGRWGLLSKGGGGDFQRVVGTFKGWWGDTASRGGCNMINLGSSSIFLSFSNLVS